jgi:hypothetical protein
MKSSVCLKCIWVNFLRSQNSAPFLGPTILIPQFLQRFQKPLVVGGEAAPTVTILRRRYAGQVFENLREILAGTKTSIEGNLGD